MKPIKLGFCKGHVQLFISRVLSCMHLGLIGVGSLQLFHVLALVFCMFFCGKYGSKLRFGRMRCAGECCSPLLLTLVGFLQHADFEPSVWSRT